ncbi:MAG: tRNA 4-thiouridine(8) synthase ThiI [Clostridium sp.]|nr:tRNA 4-thiouridine(8) synthase ThiI [Clostridium sp.]MCM1398090.1 tRNA 4-thiouridine(8) synthase ThiI [Clostridium sp.]MCM1459276.1 tRNA 4-thiouridine(8) synthase ThiI [Bacteroides sp.]
MDYKMFLIKYAEIGTKGKNRYVFEEVMCKRMRARLKALGDFEVRREYGRIYVEAFSDYDYDDVIDVLGTVFGIVGICPVKVVEDTAFDNLAKEVVSYVREEYGNKKMTFKVGARRNDKSYPKSSMEINCDMGAAILDAFDNMSVDVHNPDVMINIEVRNVAYIYSRTIPGPGGLPVGTNGKGMVLLSGGIDSPVAAYMIAKRGVEIEAVYFHAPPYTSERAKQKVIDLGTIVSRYSGPIKLHIINFTDIQLAIYDSCPHDELTIIMKRLMYKMAEELALREDCQCIITGESIGQVSSQTSQSLYVINTAISEIPVFRPCIGLDKQEIIDISEKIGTYETSILPYEDCCTTFVAKHPVTKPKQEQILKSEEALKGKIEALYEKAMNEIQIVHCR